MELTYSMVVKRALIVGLIAGALAALYLLVVAEPTVDEAIKLEEAATQGHEGDEEPLFTRGEQVGGGMLAAVIFATLLAVVFGTVYASIRHRLTGASDFTRVVLLAAVAFATTALLPALKYPANPPAVGDPDTVNERTLQYVTLVVFGIVAAIVLAKLSGRLRERFADPTRIVLVAVAVAVVYGAALVAFPSSPDSIDPAVPARLIWEFRIQSLGGLALVWAVLGLGLGWALDRVTTGDRAARPGAAPVPA
jgi:predicted cobalt transporter CbtA